MESGGSSCSNHLDRSGRNRIGTGECRSTLWMGDDLDFVGSLRRGIGSQPDSVHISFDTYNSLIFWRQKQIESRGKLAVHGLLYLVGLSVTNSVLGVVAALTGSLMGAALQNPIVLVVVACVLIFFATSLFGFWDLQLPYSLTSAASKSYAGYFGTLFMGLTLGVVAAPCLGPFVLGLLTWVASMGSPWLGFLIFFTLSLGLGLPLFFLAMFSGSLEKLPGSGEWMLWVRKLMGWVLIGMAAYFVSPLLPSSVSVFLLAGVALAAGFHLGWIDGTQGGFKAFSVVKNVVGVAGVVVGAFLLSSLLMVGPGVSWKAYSDEVMEQARKSNKPVIVDFSATWCTPCRELEDITFRDPTIVKQAADYFVMVKVDLTKRAIHSMRSSWHSIRSKEFQQSFSLTVKDGSVRTCAWLITSLRINS